MKTVKDIIIKPMYRKTRDLLWMICISRKEKRHWENLIEQNKSIENPIYYVIRRPGNPGLFSYVEITVLQVVYALKNHMIPIVDMKNYLNTYHEKDEVGIVNAWELYFKQLSNVNLDEVLSSKRYVLSENKNIDWSRTPCLDGYYNKRAYCFWSLIYDRYIRLSDEAQKYYEAEYNAILKGRADATIGVLVRGTDYKYAKGHAVQPNIEEVILKVKSVIKRRNFQYIYLATEEYAVVRRFEEEFQDRVITNKRMYFDQYDFSQGMHLNDIEINRERDKYWRGMEYLSSICLLSRCGGLIAGACGGSYGAFYMSNGRYKYTYFWNLGMVD